MSLIKFMFRFALQALASCIMLFAMREAAYLDNWWAGEHLIGSLLGLALLVELFRYTLKTEYPDWLVILSGAGVVGSGGAVVALLITKASGALALALSFHDWLMLIMVFLFSAWYVIHMIEFAKYASNVLDKNRNRQTER